MPYKKKLICLLSIIAALSLVYALTIIFAPERTGSRSDHYVWLDSKLAAQAERIVIARTQEQTVELVKKNGRWFVLRNGIEYPARRARVEDFTAVFTTRAAWPVRSSSASSHARLGLEEGTASRVTIYGRNAVLLDLLFGNEDGYGREVNVRRYGQNEVRSGDNIVTSYLTGLENGWFNLRLIPESEDGGVTLDGVQRISVYSEGQTQIFSRGNGGWALSGLSAAGTDQSAVDAYVRVIINTEGDDFVDFVSGDDPVFSNSRITLELGNGVIKTIFLSDQDENGNRLAAADSHVYLLSSWAAQRLFRNADSFETR